LYSTNKWAALVLAWLTMMTVEPDEVEILLLKKREQWSQRKWT